MNTKLKFIHKLYLAAELWQKMMEAMKTLFTLIVITTGALLSGCATGNGLTLDTVGPPLPQPTAASSTSTNGTLVVYSAFRRNADFNSRDHYRQEYSDYKIFSPNGKLLQRVHNNSGTILQDAVPVELPPGKYQVIARANGYGFVTVPVIIAARQNTILHLEGGGSWPDESAFNQTNAVRLPDGLIIGWKAAANL
ncbi:MAG: hypothetical protein ABSE16_18015 [Verrucomicrobiota bacterium]